MTHNTPSTTDKALVFCYKVQRKLRRELRKRFTPTIIRNDLATLRSQCSPSDPRTLLVEFTGALSRHWPENRSVWMTNDEAAALIEKADHATAHRFDLLGSSCCDAGDPIAWNRDLKTGFCWPEQTHHLSIPWDAVPAGTDIKMPWELSRCQHFATLALADLASDTPDYFTAFKQQTSHWISVNPCGFGVNWVCAMDVAIRAVNWLTAATIFHRRIRDDDQSEVFYSMLVESIWLHGCHIMRNLEWQGPRSTALGNHFLANLCGLLAAGILFKETPRGQRWLHFACDWFEKEIHRQVFEDGTNFETSTSYHRLTLEMFLWADTMMDACAIPFSKAYKDKILAMQAFVKAYTMPSGQASQFGDNDGGRLLTAGIGDPRDHRYLYTKDVGFGGQADQILLTGGRSITAPIIRHSFERGGYWFGQVANASLGIRAGVVSHGGAHAHADQLSFVLNIAGIDMIVDPGTGTYSADPTKRNTYRSSASHNAPRPMGWEANRYEPGMAGLFRMEDNTQCRVDEWNTTTDRVFFSGRHQGFSRKRTDCITTRALTLTRGRLEVHDRITKLKKGEIVDWTLHFLPGTSITMEDESVIIQNQHARLSVQHPQPGTIEIIETSFSPSYGIEQPAPALILHRTVDDEVGFSNTIVLGWEPTTPRSPK